MEKLEITRSAQSDQFSVVLSRGNDTIRCMVTVRQAVRVPRRKAPRSLSKAKALARALNSAIEDT